MENRKQMDIIIGNNMAAIRKSREYKQREICQVLGMNASTYKHYELGDRCVPPSVLKTLANFYKIHVDYFFENMPGSDDIREHLFFTNYRLDAVESKGIVGKPRDGFKDVLKDTEKRIQARARFRIKEYRTENKKSQQEVADYLGIDISTYNKYEKGSRKLNNEVVRKIAEYYNIKVSDILD